MKLRNTLAAVDDWKNETTVLLDVHSGGHGNGIESADLMMMKDTFLLSLFLLFFILWVLIVVCITLRFLLEVCRPHRVHSVSQPEIVVDHYYFVQQYIDAISSF
jgi:hypothetical protein